jgi:ADP-heptose:LPS heptosyltransferase
MIKPIPFEHSSIRKIAIFRALQLGDMLCAIPALRAIRKTFPHASVTLIGLPWQRGFVKRFSQYIDDFVEFPGWPGLPERQYEISEVMSFLSRVQQMSFDLVIQMQGNGYIVNPMCMLFGARYVAGLRKAEDYEPQEGLFAVMEEKEHEISRFMRIVEQIGGVTDGTELEFPILDEELHSYGRLVEKLNLRRGSYVCIHPGARDPRRRWDPCNFARVGDALVSKGYTVLLTGSQDEAEVLDEVERCMHVPVVNLVKQCGHVGIGELAMLIRDSCGLFSNDTGVSHIASAHRVRSVIIFSAWSDPDRWAPLNRNLHRVVLAEESKNIPYVLNTVISHIDIHCEDMKSTEKTIA